MSSTRQACCERPLCGIIPIALLEKIAASHDSAQARQAAERTIAHTRTFQASRYTFATPGHGPASSDSDDHRPQQSIVPPNILQGVIGSEDSTEEQKQAARTNLLTSQAIRAARGPSDDAAATAPVSHLFRTIYNSEQRSRLPGDQVIREGQDITTMNVDVTEKQVWDGFAKTYEFYQKFFNRDSLDNHGMQLVGSVHFDDDDRPPGYNNAFYSSDLRQMIFGDGDQIVFQSFTKDIDVIAHELTHGVTDKTAQLPYHLQSGALNESISDVFGSMVKQWSLGQDAASADWLIGANVLAPAIHGTCLRSMKEPGSAYNDRRLGGQDPQPANMENILDLPDDDTPGSGDDNGGVHLNSGIPNRAFFLIATGLGGKSWERAGKIWYKALLDPTLKQFAQNPDNWNSCFQFWADLTTKVAGEMYDAGVQAVVKDAWEQVGLQSLSGN